MANKRVDINNSLLAGLVSTQTGLPKTTCKAVIKGLIQVTQSALLKGHRVKLTGLCIFDCKTINPRNECRKLNLNTGEYQLCPPVPAYSKPKCVFSKRLNTEMRELTEGKPYDN